MTQSLRNKNIKAFGGCVSNRKQSNFTFLSMINNETSDTNIAEEFSMLYEPIFNDGDNIDETMESYEANTISYKYIYYTFNSININML